MTARFYYRLAAAVLFAAALGGCSPGPMIDRLPSDMGLPAGTPTRPATSTYQYPAVHDMPPPRATTTMSEEDQVKMEKDLNAVRSRQEKITGTEAKDGKETKETKKNAVQTAKKKPSEANSSQSNTPAAGGKANP